MKASRLLSLLLLLQIHQRLTTVDLARRLDVSPRTVLRDVEALSAAGVPVYAERGRHGGIVLLPGARLNVSHLEPAEMDALALAGLDSAQRDQLGVTAAHDMATRKIAARKVASCASGPGLADLVVIENSSWLAPELHLANVADLALSLVSRTRLRINYRKSGVQQAVSKVVDPYGLVAKSGRWYLVADTDHQPRLFNLERLQSFAPLPEPTRIRPGWDLRSVWAVLRQRTEAPGTIVVRARLRDSRLDLARRILGARLTGVEPGGAGWLIVTVCYDNIESVHQLLQFGNHIEVIAPDEARHRFAELATDLALRHAPAMLLPALDGT